MVERWCQWGWYIWMLAGRELLILPKALWSQSVEEAYSQAVEWLATTSTQW
jgi:hypothetical protein